MDQLKLGFDLGSNARFTYIAAKLTPWSVPEDTLYRTPEGWTRVQPTQKWLSAHRLEYALWENVLIGVSEAVVWGERGFDPAYLNPLSFIYSAQHNGQDRDNLLMEGDVTVSVRKRALIYMALLIDDLSTSQIGKGFVGNKIGVMAGAQFMDLELDGLIAGIEYIRLEPFVYTHFYPVNRFTNWTSSLGAGLKPNSDRLTLDLNYRLIRSLTCDAQFSFNRHGDLGGELSQTVIANSNRASRFLDDRHSGWTAWELQLRWEPVPGGVLECGYIQNDENSFLPDRFYLGTGYRY
jgi:hypothetical protein